MTTERVVIVGGPRCGKSWLARELRASGSPTFCGDPPDKVKDLEADVTYLPLGLAMEDESTRYIATAWFSMPGPWVCEGWIMARALRKWLSIGDIGASMPCDRVVVFLEQRPELELLPGQIAQHRGVMTVWDAIWDYFETITEYAGHESSFHGSGGVD
jgi:hypothetical protein